MHAREVGRLGLLALATALLLAGCTPAGASDARTAAPTIRSSHPTSTPTPANSVDLGISASRDSPLATIRFLARNHWDGYVDSVYTGVFAGVDRFDDDGHAPEAAVAVFQYPGPREVGIFHSGTGSTPLAVTAADGDVLQLSDGSPHGLTFALDTDTFSAVSVPTAHGCSPTATSIPRGALRARIVDVDGDGRPDTEWAALAETGLEYGITTASGATVSGTENFAGGGGRSFVVGRLANGVVAAITSEQRDSPIFAFVHCAFVSPIAGPNPDIQGSRSAPLNAYSAAGAGAVGCAHGVLEQYQEVAAGDDRVNVLETPVTIAPDGRTAVRGPVTTLIRGLDTAAHTAEAQHYFSVTCGAAAVLQPHH